MTWHSMYCNHLFIFYLAFSGPAAALPHCITWEQTFYCTTTLPLRLSFNNVHQAKYSLNQILQVPEPVQTSTNRNLQEPDPAFYVYSIINTEHSFYYFLTFFLYKLDPAHLKTSLNRTLQVLELLQTSTNQNF
jgi:hypothetical protein